MKLRPIEEIVEEFKKINIYQTARVSGYGKKMEDYLRTTLEAERTAMREVVEKMKIELAECGRCHACEACMVCTTLECEMRINQVLDDIIKNLSN